MHTPIKTNADHARTVEQISHPLREQVRTGGPLTANTSKRLVELLTAHENQHHPIKSTDPR